MLKKFVIVTALVIATSTATVLAQNTNSSTTVRPRTTITQTNTNRATPEPTRSPETQPSTTTKAAPRTTTPRPAAAAETVTPGSQAVRAAFDTLIDGIRNADVKAVTSVYWNSPRLTLFNNNGTVTRGWEQMRRNRESSYKDVKDVKLTCRDVSITMLGRDGAIGTCLWTQSQTFRGEPETATGRMTLVFKRVGKDWKIIHLHTSPANPEPSRLPASDKAASPSPNP
ncbi:MAG: AtzH-like domain-containing protein [Acidobacteriota bacterium]